MNNEQMLAALAALPDPDMLTATKIDDPLGAGMYYRADNVARMLSKERNTTFAWQPIETAPKDETDVLVYARGSYAVASWNGNEWRDMGDIGWAGMYGDEGNQPTHWMPLPEPPNAELTARPKAVAGSTPGSAAG